MIARKLTFPVYCVKWIDNNRFICGGGGGKEIPNRLELEIECEHILDDAIMELDFNKKTNLIVATDLRNFYVFRLLKKSDKFNIERLYNQSITSNDPPETKYITIHPDGKSFCVCNDQFDIEYYMFQGNSKNVKLIGLFEKGHSSDITKLKFSGNYLLSSSQKNDENEIILWSISTRKVLKRLSCIPKSKVLFFHVFKSGGLFVVYTSKERGKSGTFFSYFSPKYELLVSKKLHSYYSTTMSGLYENYFSIGYKNFVELYSINKVGENEIPRIRKIFSKKLDFVFVLTSSEVQKKENEVDIVSGSLNRYIFINSVNLNKKKWKILPIFILFFLVFSLFYLNRIFNDPPIGIIILFVISYLLVYLTNVYFSNLNK